MSSLHRYKMCKKYDVDIWGELGRSAAPSKTLHYLFLRYKLNFKIWNKIKAKRYRLSFNGNKFLTKFSRPQEKPIKLKRRTNKTKANRIKMENVVRCYYGITSKKIFRHYRKKDKSKRFFPKILVSLEMRLESIIRRLRIIPSLFVIRTLIKKGYFYLNGRQIINPYHIAPLFGIITFSKPIMNFLLPFHFRYLKQKKFKINHPSHLYFKRTKGLIIVMEPPKAEELIWPFVNHQDVIATC